MIRKFTVKAGPDPTDEPWDQVLRPRRGWAALNLGELWAYRELLYFLVWRNLKVRYKQTFLGAAWAVLQPLLAMLVFSLFFGRLAQVPSEGIPYPLFVYAALVPWTFFSNSLARASSSLVENEKMITKVYFPRLYLPAAEVLAGLVDFFFAFLLLAGLAWWYGVRPGAAVLIVPLLVGMAVLAALGAGLWLAAVHVLYRDVRYVVAFLVQFWLFASPVAYPASLVPERWRALYGLNPMTGIIEGFRWALLGTRPAPVLLVGASLLVILVLLAGGLVYFRRLEDSFADVV